jgi:hypothetical protein
MPQCINSTSPGCRNWVDQRPGPCSRRVFDFVNNRLFWLVLKFLEHNQRIANWTGFLKEKQRLKTTSTGSSYFTKNLKELAVSMNELVFKNRRLYGAQMFDVFLNRGHIRAGFWIF